MLPATVRRRAQETREATQRLVKQSNQLCDRADVLMREAEALREELKRPPPGCPTPSHPGEASRWESAARHRFGDPPGAPWGRVEMPSV